MCPKCGGKDFSETPVVTAPQQTHASPAFSAYSGPTAGGQAYAGQSFGVGGGYGVTKYAGFWIRLGAYLIDSILISIIATVVYIPIAILKGFELGSQGMRSNEIVGSLWLYSLALYALVGWLYCALFESSEKRNTWGKRLVGVVVSTDGGEQLTFGQASLRFWMKYISGFFLSLPFLTAAFRTDKKAIHDLIASTVVTYK